MRVKLQHLSNTVGEYPCAFCCGISPIYQEVGDSSCRLSVEHGHCVVVWQAIGCTCQPCPICLARSLGLGVCLVEQVQNFVVLVVCRHPVTHCPHAHACKAAEIAITATKVVVLA